MTEYGGYKVVTAEIASMKRVKSDGSGALPKTLRGLYTSFGQAAKAIDMHLNTKKVVKDGPTE